MRNRKGVDPEGRRDGEELEGVGAGETVLRLHCMRKESMFNKGAKELKLN